MQDFSAYCCIDILTTLGGALTKEIKNALHSQRCLLQGVKKKKRPLSCHNLQLNVNFTYGEVKNA